MKDVLEVFEMAQEKGDANITDRIIVKVLPELLKKNVQISSKMIDERSSIIVDDETYAIIENAAKKLLEEDFVWGSCHV